MTNRCARFHLYIPFQLLSSFCLSAWSKQCSVIQNRFYVDYIFFSFLVLTITSVTKEMWWPYWLAQMRWSLPFKSYFFHPRFEFVSLLRDLSLFVAVVVVVMNELRFDQLRTLDLETLVRSFHEALLPLSLLSMMMLMTLFLMMAYCWYFYCCFYCRLLMMMFSMIPFLTLFL